ncbi:MAG TPA: hypothetical protein PKY35_07750 [Candidatus Hydrogenedentes bacterium]|nr:hypothetical protein [Candidatus Hydrogenedentota bacterium]HOL76907.1 hypothetical protein [Candidatus Hydrogenedentota bacterium]
MLMVIIASCAIFVLMLVWVFIDRWYRTSMGDGIDSCELPRHECCHCLMMDSCAVDRSSCSSPNSK